MKADASIPWGISSKDREENIFRDWTIVNIPYSL